MISSSDAKTKANAAMSDLLAYSGTPAYKAMAVFLGSLADYYVAEMAESDTDAKMRANQHAARAIDSVAKALVRGGKSAGFVAE
jgi:hypothetical protein